MIELKEVSKTYTQGIKNIPVLHNISISIKLGEFVSIMGPSGSGKSTLLNLIGGIDQPTSGEIFINSKPLHGIKDDELTLIRRKHVGYIFQFFNLLPILSAMENVGLPLLLEGIPLSKIKSKVETLLQKVGLEGRMEHRPEQLSGGEMQRVAIARSLITDPEVLLADEPTGNLDSRSSEEIFNMLKKLNAEGQTIIMVTHDSKAADCGTRLITIKDGFLASDKKLKEVRA
ncbi:ABC transporter ATP-binding protein [Candidatus Desantisbacteria bacterium]|nr:ABC transporter ATP-binding protein [Candidatus Desantisbacteria bacterium]